MALQVWLPLNGTLENKGLSNITFTNISTANTTVNNDGKIGKCYANNSNSAGGLISNTTINLGSSQSMFCWFKFTSLESSSSLGGGMVGLHRYSKNQGMGLTLKYVSSTTGYLSINTGNGSSRTYNAYCNTTLLQANTWYHGGYTYDGNQVKIYLNGVCEKTVVISNMLTPSDYLIVYSWSLSGSSGNTIHADYKLNGSLNDVRVYDHALSPKEVKEISKGLILHYKLDGNDIGITIPRNGGLIPDGIELYDYILSSGTLWIDTGVIANLYPIEFKTNLCFTDNVTTEKDFFGNFNDGASTNCFVCGKYSRLFYQWGGNAYRVGTVVQNQFYELSYRFNGASGRILTIDGTANTSTATNNFASRTNTLGMFSGASNKVYCAASVKMKYSLILINDILVRNFLPCTYLGEPGMWDTVENKFYRNQGTGLFTLGSKITLKEYEYLESSGTLYINSGISSGSNAGYEIEFKMNSGNSPYSYICGSSRLEVASPRILTDSSGAGLISFYDRSDKSVQLFSSFNTDTTYIVKYRNGILLWNDGSSNIGIFGFGSNNFCLFACLAEESRKGKLKIYKNKIYKDDQLVRDFVPVSYNGIPGLWDRVEWKFYANAGSGSFTLGPEKTIQQDAPIFYDSSGYCNHGSIIGTLTTNNDSPRYTKSTVFNGSSAINAGHTAKVTDAITISYWAKTSVSTTAVSCSQGGGFCSLVGGNFYVYANGSYGTVPNGGAWNNNAWHHIVNTFDGRYKKIYKDGALVATNDMGAKYPIQYNANAPVWIGAESAASNTPEGSYFNGSISDVRIYATALSADDIKELYNTSAFVTDNGVFAEYELYEDNLSDVKKTGLLETADFYENGAESGYALDTDKTRVASNYIISEDFIEI